MLFAAVADQKLKEQGVLPGRGLDLNFEEQQKRVSAIEDIENEDFTQQAFISGRSKVSIHARIKLSYILFVNVVLFNILCSWFTV